MRSSHRPYIVGYMGIQTSFMVIYVDVCNVNDRIRYLTIKRSNGIKFYNEEFKARKSLESSEWTSREQRFFSLKVIFLFLFLFLVFYIENEKLKN